jgi:two-component system cell cycle sensor histidine kinase/response regulator CckA
MAPVGGRGRSRADEGVGLEDTAVQEPRSLDETLYEELFNNSTDACVIWTLLRDRRGTPRDLVFVAANEAFRRLFDLPEPMDGRLSRLDRRFRDKVPDLLEICARVAATGVPETHEKYYPALGKWFQTRFFRPIAGRVSAAVADITEVKQAEEALRRARFSLDRLTDYPIWTDSEGRVFEVSESTCSHLEYTRDELLNMTIFEINPDLAPKSWPDRWRQSKALGSFHVETRHRTKSGRLYPVEAAVNNMVFEGKEYDCALCRDITERNRLEQRLQLMRYTLDRSDDYPMWTDVEGRIIDVSESTCRHLEYTRDELLNMTVFDINPTLTEQTRRYNLKERKGVGTVVVKDVHRAKSGRQYPVEISISAFTFDDIEYHCAFCRDITQRTENEESLLLTQLSADSAPDMVHWTGLDGRLAYANQSMADCLGYSREELLSLHIWDVVDDLSPELFMKRWARARGGDSFRREGTFRTKDGRLVPVEVWSHWVELKGRLLAISSTRDISERVQMLHALRERDEQLRQSQKMEAIGRLAGGIAHDFNNVLTTIAGYSDLILSSPDCPQGSIAEDIGEIKAAAERAGGLTRRILAFSRRQALQPTVLSLNAVVSDTERLLARTIGADVELRLSLSPDLGQVEVDETQFVQVLLNLAVNARDAMPRGGVLTLDTADVHLDELFCETHPDAHPGPYVTLTVSDSGTGMDADTLAHAFEPFYTTKPPGEGTGLGLSTVYGVVAQSGGFTYVHSEPGRGTTFTIYLPRAGTQTAPRKAELSPSPAEKQGQTIMVVENDATFLGLTTRVLEKRGYRILPFSDAEQAAAALGDESIRPDALLTDIMLPGSLQGDQLARLALARRPDLPVLFMSDQARDTMVRSGRLDEQTAYLEKPFTTEELTSRVRKCLSGA